MTSLSTFNFFVSCAKGLEYLLEQELLGFGVTLVKTSPAGVVVTGNQADMMRICLNSRLASRVLLELGETRQATREGVYELAKSVQWSDYLDPGKTYWISAFGSWGDIRHSRFGAQVVKDAVNDYFRDRQQEIPVIEKDTAAQSLQLNIGKTITLGVDVTGRSLHQRGYRREGEAAPLKETLAAALLMRAGWPEHCGTHGMFLDPMCGSGTLAIEAALMALDIAPGLISPQFAFFKAPWFDKESWVKELGAAQERAVLGKRRWSGVIAGNDLNPNTIRSAKRNLARAGVDRWVQLTQGDAVKVTAVTPPDPQEADDENVFKLLLTNPPYGERLGQELELRGLYQNLGRQLKREFHGWKAGVFTSSADLARELGVRANKQYKLFNGKLPTTLYLFDVYTQNLPSHDAALEQGEKRVFSEQAQMFANRLSKNLKKRRKWAARENLEAYRIYDADMPEYAVAVDWYHGAVCIQEYAPPKSIDENKAHQRLLDVLEVVPEVCGVPKSAVFLKQRKRQKGVDQYGKVDRAGRELSVMEHGCRFWVNLSDYLDTGLFLDHRPMRYWIQKHAKGKRFLNLFCYTGSASVHAAYGGAASTTSVDLSQTYLSWAERNFVLNHLAGKPHRFVRANVMEWLEQEKGKGLYDLIFLDPPTFSNSKKMESVLDIQRDHVSMIQMAMDLLADDGVLIFSNNYRRFKLDSQIEQKFQVEDKSRESLPEDFERNQRIHQCWFIRHSR
ncbi:23S rRNA (guanine(2445)-N(2))/(guanine(2069)-N(7))-methyltransferase [Hahella sp. CCB-MM4]|uniref:bifunctional 23S rRNA (guanine(2069)-N(7))-methyltransferase RlmK/23S rRNA (guanine(2445)-N(2))-methyltransferase RlmL n=1 Tax=Hahella sp. (strain CCB-MM4) TaxID=1926491 RepID=UPI000B9B7DD5|nr:bifunctional 23S rRNA (guanine(2069)-N(7))-methyltransferase RlmK/23S rRNA (guanine(2445)-N(2))-methyltransferase RlmL [Hahella sp. CCB-MM4]OZG72078.1 23S rRNA (guanine(2445)-N(2))/(guanine(2069)-N(7))-methyltransferase [Hahella sp. CCB-MM4]